MQKFVLTHTYIHLYIHTCTDFGWEDAKLCAHTHTYIYTYIHAQILGGRMQKFVLIDTYIHLYIHACTDFGRKDAEICVGFRRQRIGLLGRV